MERLEKEGKEYSLFNHLYLLGNCILNKLIGEKRCFTLKFNLYSQCGLNIYKKKKLLTVYPQPGDKLIGFKSYSHVEAL